MNHFKWIMNFDFFQNLTQHHTQYLTPSRSIQSIYSAFLEAVNLSIIKGPLWRPSIHFLNWSDAIYLSWSIYCKTPLPRLGRNIPLPCRFYTSPYKVSLIEHYMKNATIICQTMMMSAFKISKNTQMLHIDLFLLHLVLS